MDRVSKLIGSALALFAAVFVSLLVAHPAMAYGTITATTQNVWGYYCGSNLGSPPWAESKEEACEMLVDLLGRTHTRYVYCSATGDTSTITDVRTIDSYNGDSGVYIKMTSTPSCPSMEPGSSTNYYGILQGAKQVIQCDPSSFKTATQCICLMGTEPDPTGTFCRPIDCADAARYEADVSASATRVTQRDGLEGCWKGCKVRGDMAADGEDGNQYLWNIISTGGYCSGVSGDGTNPPDMTGSDIEPAPEQVPKGKCPGTVNGQPVLVDCKSTTTKGEDTPDASDSSASSPTGSDTSNTTTKSVTKCEGEKCVTTTTTTTTKSDGSKTDQVTTKTQTKTELCKKDPRNMQCSGSGGGGGDGEDESSWGGNCQARFQCSGDAIQCAMAQEQHNRNCQLFEDVTPEVEEGLVHITEGAASGVRYEQTEVDVGALFTVLPGNPWGGSCPADVEVAGMTIPLSEACTALQLLGAALVAFTLLACAGWLVSKGV